MADQADTENKQTVEFDGQHDDETVLFTFRNHLIAMRKGFYMLLIPFLIASLPSLLWPGELLWLWVALGGFLFGLLLFMYYWMGWYFSVYIVTDQRFRQVTWKGLFGKSVIDLGISKIQNISYNVPGLNATLFGFGTIVIQTYVGDLVLENIEHPAKTYEKLQSAIKTYGSAEAEINK